MKYTEPLLAVLATYGLVKWYESQPLPTQQQIRQIFNLHHGTVGLFLVLVGLLKNDARVISVGLYLMFHDRKDAPLWKNDLDSISKKINQILEQPKQQLPYITPLRLPNRF